MHNKRKRSSVFNMNIQHLITTMARPIAETPTLYGKDAKRFAENMRKVESLSQDERQANRDALSERLKSAEKKWGKFVFLL